MKTVCLIFVFALVSVAANAEPKAKPTLQSCTDLAQQRGFTGGNSVNIAAKRAFITNCMRGKQS